MGGPGKAVRLAAAIVVCSLWLVCSAAAQGCSHADDFSFYSHGDYVVRQVRITSPLDFLPFVSHSFDEVKKQLPVQPGKAFSASAVGQGHQLIRAKMEETENALDPRSRLLVIIDRIANCNEAGPKELDVVYRVFTTNYNSYFSHSWETKSEEIERPAAALAMTTAETTSKPFFMVTPYVDYNRTTQLSGGTRMAMRMPGGLFDTMQMAASASTTSNFEQMELAGSRLPQQTALNHLEYRLAYTHSDAPAGNNRLQQGTLAAAFFGASKPLGPNQVVVRFGASVEGGNRQSQAGLLPATEESVESSGYGSLKSYIGATLRTERYSFAGSYGLQIGTQGATATVDFVKHIGDVALTARWFRKDPKPGEFHKSITLETRFIGGAIQTLGQLPVAERFFGGNAVPDFMVGNSWRIAGGPLIRSIPQNRLNAASTLGPIGGTSFYSANFTISAPVWGYPIIPKAMAADPQFLPALQASKASAREILIQTYKSRLTDVYAPLIAHLAPVEQELAQLSALLDSLPANAGSDVKDAASDLHDSLAITMKVLADKKSLPGKLDGLLKEPNSATCEDELNCSLLTDLRNNLGALVEALDAAHAEAESRQAKGIGDRLAAQQPPLVAELNGLNFSEAVKLADADMQAIEPVLHSFLNEINIIAVSPVGIFDVARIWPDRFGTRYGIGGGVRLSLVNFNITVGYAFNPHPRFQEGRGALVFSMDVTDLFR